MKEFNFNSIENLSKDLSEGIVNLSGVDLQTQHIQPLLNSVRLLHERLVILQHLVDKNNESNTQEDLNQKVEENQINLIDVIVEEEAKAEITEKKEIKTSKSINDIHSSSPQISLADQFGQQPIIDLKKEIGINERYLMTENLFSGDSEAFTNAITQLNQLNNHNDALDYLKKELSKKYNWNLKSNHVKRLFKLVERRYQ
jgi:hypothetical protein|tara:strand:+ start:456 stop:1055 length:600 start_codon:yes stop_codon:yes gene_type:complete